MPLPTLAMSVGPTDISDGDTQFLTSRFTVARSYPHSLRQCPLERCSRWWVITDSSPVLITPPITEAGI